LIPTVATGAAAGLALLPALSTDGRVWAVAIVAGSAVLLLGSGVTLRRPVLLAWSLALLGAEYGIWLAQRGGSVDARAPLYAAGLLIVAELSYQGLERSPVGAEPELLARRGLQLVLMAVGTVAVGTVVLGAASIPIGGGAALTTAGVAALLLALALLARLAR
jgi:hypothetical protein